MRAPWIVSLSLAIAGCSGIEERLDPARDAEPSLDSGEPTDGGISDAGDSDSGLSQDAGELGDGGLADEVIACLINASARSTQTELLDQIEFRPVLSDLRLDRRP